MHAAESTNDLAVSSGSKSPAEASLRAALRCLEAREFDTALQHFQAVAADRPPSAALLNFQARAWEGLGKTEEALACIDAALQLNPLDPSDWRNHGVLLKKLGRNEGALSSFDRALSIRPDTDVLTKKAFLLNELDQREAALACIDQAYAMNAHDPGILNARAIILESLEQYADAKNTLDELLTRFPNHVDGLNNYGMVMARLGHFDRALSFYTRSLSQKSDQDQARYNRSVIRLCLGDWRQGFEEFETRWQTDSLRGTQLQTPTPLWLGHTPLTGKTLLVYHEQGFGDTLQCIRYVPLLEGMGAKVVLAVPRPLKSLARTLPGNVLVVADGDPLPAHDLHCPLMSLPLAFRTTPQSIPAPVPYLRAEAGQAARWNKLLGPRKKLRIGIAWGGRRYAPINYARDLALPLLDPLLALDAEFICLQKEFSPQDLKDLEARPKIRLVTEELTDFAATAALVEVLDLTICVDSAVAHLAGAMGRPVWLMNRFASCWRWLQSGSDSGWYPTLTLFRQPAVGNWPSVIANIKTRLQEVLDGRAGTIPAGRAALITTPVEAVPTASVLVSSAGASERPPAALATEKIRLICATRGSSDEFFAKAALGRSLPHYRTFPRGQGIELRLFKNNQQGVSSVYNIAIEEARADPAILVFVHDDVYLSDFYWANRIHEALSKFDIVGLAGNRRRVPRQASWMYLDDTFTRDDHINLSGVLGHGEPFPALTELSVYGDPGQQVKLLDGVLMAVCSDTLLRTDLRFDPRFEFHFYDMDFCRQAEIRGLRLGTWAISVVHASPGRFGVEAWRKAYQDYLLKYGE